LACVRRTVLQQLGTKPSGYAYGHSPAIDPRRLVVDVWTGSDYGFSGSVAFSVLLARSPEGGPIYVLDEFPHDLTQARKIDVKRFAREHYQALIKMPLRYDQPQRTAAMYLGPDCWSERGDSNTLADLANQELEKHDLEFQQARNDRAGGAQLVYTMLQTGELVIADTCQNVIRAIESRAHDKKAPLKVEKAIGDPYDDVWDALRYALYSPREEAVGHACPGASERHPKWRRGERNPGESVNGGLPIQEDYARRAGAGGR
jgi:hypothetical protein